MLMGGIGKPVLISISIRDVATVFSSSLARLLGVLAAAAFETSVCGGCVLSGAAATTSPATTPAASAPARFTATTISALAAFAASLALASTLLSLAAKLTGSCGGRTSALV